MARLPPRSPAPLASGLRVAVITSSFNAPITDAMRKGALAELTAAGCEVTVDVRAPGTYDIPVLADAALARPDVDALVALGAVITGKTKHDELVTHAAAKALLELATRYHKPIGLGITGPGQTQAQARARIDRGAFAARSVVEQANVLRRLRA